MKVQNDDEFTKLTDACLERLETEIGYYGEAEQKEIRMKIVCCASLMELRSFVWMQFGLRLDEVSRG